MTTLSPTMARGNSRVMTLFTGLISIVLLITFVVGAISFRMHGGIGLGAKGAAGPLFMLWLIAFIAFGVNYKLIEMHRDAKSDPKPFIVMTIFWLLSMVGAFGLLMYVDIYRP